MTGDTKTIEDTSSPAGQKRSASQALLPWITTPLLLALLIGIWHFYVTSTNLSAFILPAPAKVWDAWLDMLGSPRAWRHTWLTIYVTLSGFAWAVVIGVGLGVISGAHAGWN